MNDFDLVNAVLSLTSNLEEEEDDDDEEIRELVKTLFRLFWMRARAYIGDISRELAMLREAPRPNDSQRVDGRVEPVDNTWRLDNLNNGPLLDRYGKVKTNIIFTLI